MSLLSFLAFFFQSLFSEDGRPIVTIFLDSKLGQKYGAPSKKFAVQNIKTWANFGQLRNFNSNISGRNQVVAEEKRLCNLEFLLRM